MRRLRLALLLVVAILPSQAQAARILALSPHACEMLYAIGGGPQVVGAVSYCDYPAEAKQLPRIGSYERINVEAALRLKPDVAVVINRNVGGVAMLERMGVRIVLSNPDSFEAIFTDLLQMGDITGHRHHADALVAGLRSRLKRIRQRPKSKLPVFYEVWNDPILTAGGPSFITELIREAGGRNIFADIAVETPHVSVESVIRAKPAVIIIPLEERSLAQRQTFWQQWLGGQKVRFVAINPDLLHRPGPRLLDGLELLQQALQKAGDE